MSGLPVKKWIDLFASGAMDGHLSRYYGAPEVATWRARYDEALVGFEEVFGDDGRVVIARCPGQMNVMGVHIDYGGMPSIRLAVRGADTLTVARANADGHTRLRNILRYPGEAEDRFAPAEFDLAEHIPQRHVGDRQAMMDYAGEICRRRQAEIGEAMSSDWGDLVLGQMVFLESYFRRELCLKGCDAMVWSNVSPSGGMSSSSALVISTAMAVLGVNDLRIGRDLPTDILVDGVGTSEWMRGTRGGTADHGGMVMGKIDRLVSVGVFPAQNCGEAILPKDYVAVVFDSGVPRVYDEAVKEETVIAYPLGTFFIRDILLPQWRDTLGFERLVADYSDRIVMIRDITEENIGVSLHGIYRLFSALPCQTTLSEVRLMAGKAGVAAAYEAMFQRDIAGKFHHINDDFPIMLRRRFVYGLTEQDRVRRLIEYLNAGRMETALELVRIAHDGDLDTEVTDAELLSLQRRSVAGEERARLCFLPGGYGRMTADYDRVARRINDFLLAVGGADAGAVQRFGAGWGGNVGGLIKREFIQGDYAEGFEHLIRHNLGLSVDLESCVAVPGAGACLVEVLGQ